MKPENDVKNLILGTAGHVDHGKTTLIKAMTGIDTDRLKEEQERGLTIDLGFAFLKLPSGREIGIVDVPGHEKFLKNMLAGATGVDIALLVIAADEGVMPQTREHLEILKILETRLGVVALTKCDMVDDEWLEVVEEDVTEALQNTFLSTARMLRVSGVTGEGAPELISEIDRLAQIAEQRSIEGPFRLPIDRVFTMTGFGTVVTGTLASGTIKIGDPVAILPGKLESRVRQLQVHGVKREVVYAGSRVAVNLAGIDLSDVGRGSVLLPPGYLRTTRMVDASVAVLKESPRPLANRTRVRLHIGTVEAIGRVAILGAEKIEPGESGYVQLRLESDVVAARGDRFVLRFYSPPRVLGGGTVLDPASVKHRRADKAVLQRLERTRGGNPADMVEDALSVSEAGLAKSDLASKTSLGSEEVSAAVERLLKEGRVIESGGRLFQKAAYEMVAARIKSALASYHEANPIRAGMPKEELRAKLGPRMDQKGFQAIFKLVSSTGEVAASEANIRLAGHEPKLDEKQQRTMTVIETELREAGVNPPLLADLEQEHGPDSREILARLIERGELVRVTAELVFHRSALENAETALRQYLQENGKTTVAQFRDLIGSSRRYVVPLMEYFDAKRVTRRVGDERTLF